MNIFRIAEVIKFELLVDMAGLADVAGLADIAGKYITCWMSVELINLSKMRAINGGSKVRYNVIVDSILKGTRLSNEINWVSLKD